MTIEAARAIADTVLYEGYLLYPYRASAAKNRSRWQFGVLGPPGAAPDTFAEEPSLSLQCLLQPGVRDGAVTIHLRFLQLQRREVQDPSHRPVDRLTVTGETLLTWDEAVEHDIALPAVPLSTGPSTVPGPPTLPVAFSGASTHQVSVPGGTDVEDLGGGRIVRRRHRLTARVDTEVTPDGDLLRLAVTVTNTHPGTVTGKDDAVRHSLLGAHLLIEARDARFVSMQDPPPEAADAATRCRQHRCWPVLAGSPEVLLGAPIILYDNPEVAVQSPGALFDATEIDEILTLRVMTMTDAEKAEARATDPRAAAIVDRCDALTPAELTRLHGTRLGQDHGPGCDITPDPAASFRDDVPWWGPGADAAVDPETDVVLVGGVRVAKGSLVRVRPTRRADAQDIFFAGRVARVTAIVSDVDGGSHVAVVLVDDPAADLHDWYGRYFYFAPDEIEPLALSGEEP